ncbi:BamA/TamA family outer membrane protein [candidate division KSB1 bacterium]|nr:BamA/TamA family outer membrane protein [candidate division KSB1 bacterium]
MKSSLEVYFVIVFLFSGMIFGQTLSGDYRVLGGRRIKEIIIRGNSKTKDWVIRREIYSQVGEPFDPQLMAEDRNRIDNLQIFSEVRITPIPSEGDTSITLLVRVKERLNFFPYPTLDWTEENGWMYGGGAALENFRGRNQKLYFEGLFGGVTNFFLKFSDPWITGNHVSMGIKLFRKERENRYEEFYETSYGFRLSAGRYFSEYIKTKAEGGYLSLTADRAGKTISPSRRDHLPWARVILCYDNRDLYYNPHKGWLNTFSLSHTGLLKQDQPNFQSFTADVRRYLPLWFDHVLGINGLLALQGGRVPIYQGFYLGGVATVRGWDPNSRRGRNLFLASTEYRFDLLRKKAYTEWFDFGLGGVLFVDSGIVWDTGDQCRWSRGLTGYGLGIRLFMPIVGVFRIDLAWNTRGQIQWEIYQGAKF